MNILVHRGPGIIIAVLLICAIATAGNPLLEHGALTDTCETGDPVLADAGIGEEVAGGAEEPLAHAPVNGTISLLSTIEEEEEEWGNISELDLLPEGDDPREGADSLYSGDTSGDLGSDGDPGLPFLSDDGIVAEAAGIITTRVSVDFSGTEGNRGSYNPSISADGRYVAFESDATNLVTGDTNRYRDIFVIDRYLGRRTRVSVSSDGTQGNGHSGYPSISADGRYVAFDSYATNLVTGDTNGVRDAFVHDRHAGTTTRVSVSSGGAEGNGNSYSPSISADGRYVAFGSAATNLGSFSTGGKANVYVHDMQSGVLTRVSVSPEWAPANGDSYSGSISADGRYVAFYSYATNLVTGDTNGVRDAFVRDRQAGTTTRVSVSSVGNEGNGESYHPSISADGRHVAFESTATNLVTGDTNGYRDVYVRDRQAGTTTRVSISSGGAEGNYGSYFPIISGDGRHVAFESVATNLVTGDTNSRKDIFVHDRKAGTTTRVSVSSAGTEGNGYSEYPSISADGKYVAFASWATNLDTDDTNGAWDVFVATFPSLTVTTPNGGESWKRGTTHTIMWEHTGNPGENVKIQLLKGTTVNTVITKSTWIGFNRTSRSYSWKVPFNQALGNDYKIRVISTSNTAIRDVSNAAFTISAGAPITVTKPNGGESWMRGTTQTIRWKYTGNPGSEVKIVLLKDGVADHVITRSTPIGANGVGSYSWLVPAAQVPGTDYKVRIISTTDTTKKDVSNKVFRIKA